MSNALHEWEKLKQFISTPFSSAKFLTFWLKPTTASSTKWRVTSFNWRKGRSNKTNWHKLKFACQCDLPRLIIDNTFENFPCGSAGKESACNEGDLGSIPGLIRSPGEGKGYPFQYFGLESSMDCIVHGVTQSATQRKWVTFTFTLKTSTISVLITLNNFYPSSEVHLKTWNPRKCNCVMMEFKCKNLIRECQNSFFLIYTSNNNNAFSFCCAWIVQKGSFTSTISSSPAVMLWGRSTQWWLVVHVIVIALDKWDHRTQEMSGDLSKLLWLLCE